MEQLLIQNKMTKKHDIAKEINNEWQKTKIEENYNSCIDIAYKTLKSKVVIF